MSDPRFDEILLESIIKRKNILPGGLKKTEPKVVSEKQSDKERHQKHKEWRKKNPQLVRDQVARHQEKTDQNKSREDTRQRDKPKKPCADCGSTENVQQDHDRGYGKGAPTTPRCHKCHTNRPQQNKAGQKSVRGGTVRVPKESKKIDPSIKFIMNNMWIL